MSQRGGERGGQKSAKKVSRNVWIAHTNMKDENKPDGKREFDLDNFDDSDVVIWPGLDQLVIVGVKEDSE